MHKCYLITGAGSGIGQALAIIAAEQGAEVILLGRSIEKLEATYDFIMAQKPEHTPLILPFDLIQNNPEAYTKLALGLSQEIPHLDGLIHCAGILGPLTPLSQYSIDAWQRVMQVNVTGGFLMTQALLPMLKQSEKAHIIFSSSSVGKKGRAHWGAYSVSKFAVEGLGQIFQDELENTSQITVHVINPGATRTPMRATAFPAEDPNTLPLAKTVAQKYFDLLQN
jgi:NAD(P)-dependent dehydrogenase (short-subunit alcohol dehydrogenase family)